jgi:hypothetical protein
MPRPISSRMSTKACLSLVASLVLSACTKPNPKNCGDGSCTDPAFPFCDVDGSVGGEPNTCVAVTCTADQFVACRDDLAITCNAQGNNYDEIKCDKGCDPTVGCRVCDPNQTVCADGKLQTCDANGVVTSSETCALGCFEDQPRCRDIDPSNGLAVFLDMVANPPDLVLTNGFVQTETGVVTDGGNTIDVPNFLVTAPPGGVPIRVFIVNSATITKLSIDGGSAQLPKRPAFALIARGDITVSGSIVVGSNAGEMATGCDVGDGQIVERVDGMGNHANYAVGGGGGGGHGTVGARGGSSIGVAAGGTAGSPAGTETLVPLRGGCAGGSNDGLGGGGAIQLTSGTQIQINGPIDVGGLQGTIGNIDQLGGVGVAGGGAGGGLLVEAPVVSLGASAKLLAPGGAGNGFGSQCDASTCGVPGVGATGTTPASAGGDIANANRDITGGGGGGGLGRIRINTKDGNFTQLNSTVINGLSTAGLAATR